MNWRHANTIATLQVFGDWVPTCVLTSDGWLPAATCFNFAHAVKREEGWTISVNGRMFTTTHDELSRAARSVSFQMHSEAAAMNRLAKRMEFDHG